MLVLFEIIVSVTFILLSAWSMYNLPVFLIGLRSLTRPLKVPWGSTDLNDLSFSLIVPMKNELKVAKRSLEALLALDYPSSKFEILVVDDGSTDGTSLVLKELAVKHADRVKLLQNTNSNGKAAALNYALKHASGDVVGVFDADNVPDRDSLKKVSKYFNDAEVAAVQGVIDSINAEENMWTRILHYEAFLRMQVFQKGKDVLGLFVALAGSCQFIRREVLEETGGWRVGSLSEDLDLSAQLVEKRHTIRFALDVRSSEENASSLGAFFKQRLRWARGSMEVGLRYGRLMKNLTRKSVDAEIFLLGPHLVAFSSVVYLLGIFSLFASVTYGFVSSTLALLLSIFTGLTLLAAGVALMYRAKPRKVSNAKWIPFLYLFWGLNNFVAVYALGQIILRRPRIWRKTPRSGVVTETCSRNIEYK